MEEKKDQNERQKLLEELIDLFAQGKTPFKQNLKTWPGIDKKEKEILQQVKEITDRENRKTKRYLILVTLLCVAAFGFSLYMYFSYQDPTVSYAILPGNIREVKLPYGKIWINGNSKLDLQSDSIIYLHEGEVFLKKEDGKQMVVVTPQNKVVLIQGNTNVLTRGEQYERITSLGTVKLYNDKDTMNLKYGSEFRRDSSKVYVQQLQSPEYVGNFTVGKIAFENETIGFVVNQISNLYNTKISYTILPNVVVSLIVDKKEDPAEVMKKILPAGWYVSRKKDGTLIVSTKQVGDIKE
ncbi:MAG TPA: hypothetical protein VGQ59_07440 [Cyclobacteriaceae bacterium]|jgi:hypothetical protein|nr:hypothetical protein [Cyclobacteriaceae bacterium]